MKCSKPKINKAFELGNYYIVFLFLNSFLFIWLNIIININKAVIKLTNANKLFKNLRTFFTLYPSKDI